MSYHPLNTSREIVERVVVEGRLIVETPMHLGRGDAEATIDMPLLVDEATGRALLPGTSLAGALRSYLRERLLGYGAARPSAAAADGTIAGLLAAHEILFGGDKADPEGEQSCLIVEDALGPQPRVELRDGVRIDPETRTAYMEKRGGRLRGFKFDLELLEAGTAFDLRLELLVPAGSSPELKRALALALHGLALGEIPFGLRKRRGFGRCSVPEWHVTHYDLCQAAGLLAWLAEGHEGWGPAANTRSGPDIAGLLDVDLGQVPERRQIFHLQATFALDSSLLIRSGFGQQDQGPDVVHLHARRAGADGRVPVLSGTSLAGALRGRALRIARTLAGDHVLAGGKREVDPRVTALLDGMFGPAEIPKGKHQARASRLQVGETVIENGTELVQNRIRIDRFTGGAYESALFGEQPLFGHPGASNGQGTRLAIDLALRNPTKAEIGLVLLLLKDLWTRDLPLGGEASIGRGRLQGLEAKACLDGHCWHLVQASAGEPLHLTEGSADDLNEFVGELQKELGR